MGSYVYKVTNVSSSIQSFQNYTLVPQKSLTVRKLSPGVITAYMRKDILLEPPMLDVDVFRVVNVSHSIISLDDLVLKPQEFGWIEGLDVTILTMWQQGLILLDPNPFDVPIYDGSSPVGVTPVGGGSNSDTNFQDVINADSVNLQFGFAVYSLANGISAKRAQGNNVTTKSVWGIVAASSIPPGDTGSVCMNGTITGTNAQWSVATGVSGGLIINAPYYLSTSNPGKITPFGPVPIPGEDLWAIQVGYAISSTQLKVEIQQSVKL